MVMEHGVHAASGCLVKEQAREKDEAYSTTLSGTAPECRDVDRTEHDECRAYLSAVSPVVSSKRLGRMNTRVNATVRSCSRATHAGGDWEAGTLLSR